MTVLDLMTTKVITLRWKDTVETAQDRMEMAEVRHLPVLDGKGHLVGILSDRDIFRSRGLRQAPWLVAEIMMRSVRTIAPEAPADEAVRRMLDLRIGCLPVVSGGKLVGIVTETDILSLAHRMLLPPTAAKVA